MARNLRLEFPSLPTKWMGADGRTVHLVFPGDDSLPIRQGTLVDCPVRN